VKINIFDLALRMVELAITAIILLMLTVAFFHAWHS
jgi:hypothetical protein